MNSLGALVFFLFSLAFQVCHSQVGVRGGALIPNGKWAEYWEPGFGAGGYYRFQAARNVQVTFGASRYSLPGKVKQLLFSRNPDSRGRIERVLIYPVYTSLDYFISKNVLIGVTAGGIFFDEQYHFFASATGASNTVGDWYLLSPQIGYDKGCIRILVTYSILDTNYLAISTSINLFKPKFL